MPSTRLFVHFVAAFVALYGIVGIASLSVTNFYGDLTRIGRLAEYSFGWQQEQPHIERGYLVSSRIRDADVLVIGDSFSIPLVWQTQLVLAGKRVSTLSFRDLKSVCRNDAALIVKMGFRGKVIVIESVERSLNTLLLGSLECDKRSSVLPDGGYMVDPPQVRPSSHFAPDLKSQVPAGFWTIINTLGFAFGDAEGLYHGKDQAVRIRHVPNGCDVFSNRACRAALFLEADEHDNSLGAGSAKKMRLIEERLRPFTVVWMVIPDKTSVYFESEKPFWRMVGTKVHAPDFLSVLRQARTEIKDLYYPNNTHLSTSGYLLVGKVMASELALLP